MIVVFTCSNDFTSMLTCIYEAGRCGLGYSNFKLCVEPLDQLSMFEQYVHVEPDEAKAAEVERAISTMISPSFYSEVLYCAGAYEPDTLDCIYRVIALGFKYGPNVLKMYQLNEVARFLAISKRYGGEAHSFREFSRFSRVGNAYVAHIEPRSSVLLPVAEYFADRLPSENWIIVDDVHREAVIHPANESYFLQKLADSEFKQLLVADTVEDEFTVLWKSYFEHIAVEARANYRCQRNHFPKWKRKHATEFVAN